MSLKKIFSLALLLLFSSSLLFSQSLADLAKKEKERREKLKSRKGIIITNADLASVKKRPAVSMPEAVFQKKQNKRITTPKGKSTTKRTQPRQREEGDKIEFQKTTSDLEEKWKKAKEYSDLLTLKMKALWQEFYSIDDMTSRESIQRKINGTHLKLQKAKKEEEKAKKELNQLRLQPKK